MLDSRRASAVAGLAILLAVCVGATDVGQSPAPMTGSGRMMLEHLPRLILTEADLTADLAGFVEADAQSIPNEVMANTGGDGEPVALDDPDFGDELANLNGWGRLGGYRVTLTRDTEPGQPYEIQVTLELTDSDAGAHDLYAGWFASEPNGCLEVGDESDCPFGIGILLQAADGSEELLTARSATFRAGRLIGEVHVWARSTPEERPGPALEGIAKSLAVQLLDNVERWATSPLPMMEDPVEPPSDRASPEPTPEPTPGPTTRPAPGPTRSPSPLPAPEMAASPEPTPSCVPPPADPFSVGSLVWDASFSFIGGYIAAQEETASCLGIDLDVQDGQRDPATQTAAIERFIEQSKDLIIVSSGNPAELGPAIRDAYDAGIPVIAAVVPVDGAEVVTFVGYDEDAMGRKQGEMLVAAVGDEARVGLIRGEEGWTASIEQGLTDYLAKHPGIEIIERHVTEGDEAGLLAVTEEWLATYPPGELAGIAVQPYLEVASAARLATDQGRSDVKFFAGYYTDTVDDAITDGRIHGTILEDPRPIGAASIEDAYHWLTADHDAVEQPEHFLTPTIVTIANVDEYPAWEARPAPGSAPTPVPTATPEPEPTPSPRPLTIGDLDRQAYRMCVRARPDDLYSVRASVAPAKRAKGMDTVHVVLVEYRDLRGARRREPRIKADSVYYLRWSAPFDWESAGDIDAVACLALRATQRETWHHTTTLARYAIDAADAIIWMVDATDGKSIGRPWLRRPRPATATPILSSGEVLVGKHGPGIRPPPEAAIIRDVKRCLRG